MNVYEKLAAIQQEIKVTKDRNNDFAGFKYRSAEDIMEQLKPLLAKHKAVAWLTDEPVELAGQVYIKAWAHVCNLEETGEEFAVSASAREEKTRPKMSEGQLTGAASSYARKYALNGLLLLDDNKDPDSQDNTAKEPPKVSHTLPGAASDKQRETIRKHLSAVGVSLEEQPGYLIETYGVEIPLTKEGASFVIGELFSEPK